MANEIRQYQNFIGGLLTASLSATGTTLTSDGLAAMSAVDSLHHMVVVLDPDGLNGEPEATYVTAHTAAATTATIVRGKEGSTGRAHDIDIPWVHTLITSDMSGAATGSVGSVDGLLACTTYNPGTRTVYTLSATMAD